MDKLTIGLFNDSFPPTIDGVANVTVNYAGIIEREYGRAVVATPFYPDAADEYPFEVIRYPSAYLPNNLGYRAGYPFDPIVLNTLEAEKIDLIHSHCPVISTVLARMLRRRTNAPIVLTYHTKYDIDIEKLTANDMLRRISLKFLLQNIQACDEVWVVSHGAGENLRSIGYEGDYIVMENGTDFEKRRAPRETVEALRAQHGIGADETVFLFVGRMMWYKGLRLSLDALARAKAQGAKFRYLMVGDGTDREEVEAYIRELGLEPQCVLTGAIHDRELLRAYFSLADLFLFPSTFDTNGIVVREAAACQCPSLLVRGSCAAEGIEHEDTGLLVEENPEAICAELVRACGDRARLKQIGQNAERKIYLSWDEAVRRARERYGVVLENYRAREDEEETSISDAFSDAFVQFSDGLYATREQLQEQFQELVWGTRDIIEHLQLSRGQQHDLFRSPWERRK